MISSLLRLLALRPFLGMAILGVPIIALIAIGLMTVLAFKLFAALVIPITFVLVGVWLVRRLTRNGTPSQR